MVTEGTSSRYIAGDIDPTEFSWTTVLTHAELYNLLQRNGKIRKACAWVSREAVRPRFELKKDGSIVGTKFGKPYTFQSTLDYLEWIEFFQELEKVYTWSRLLGTSIIVMFKEGEAPDALMQPAAIYDSLRAYHPMIGNGYQIVKEGTSFYYKITFTDELGNVTNYNVCKERVVPFHAPHLELKYAGSSVVEPLAKLAYIQEQTLKSFMSVLHKIGVGITVINAKNATEKETLALALGDAIAGEHVIYTSGDPEKVFKSFSVDLKSAQFREIWDISQEEVANDMNMSKKLISGDSQGAISSAKYDTEVSYTEVYQTQRHFKKATEHVLYLLGIKETSFTWNDPYPDEELNTEAEMESYGGTPENGTPESGIPERGTEAESRAPSRTQTNR